MAMESETVVARAPRARRRAARNFNKNMASLRSARLSRRLRRESDARVTRAHRHQDAPLLRAAHRFVHCAATCTLPACRNVECVLARAGARSRAASCTPRHRHR
jgi:hypothetical protein